MSIADYVSFLHGLISATPFVTATSLSFEERPPSAGSINGTIRFIDGSQLDFKEFVIIQPRQEVIKYGYHYRMSDRLIFRYDNANDPAARNFRTFPHHKHLPSGLVAAEKTSLEQILREIASQLKIP